jgi:ABC-2 type transport system ATP-binding protein
VIAAVRAKGLGKRYGRHWGLANCNLEIPTGRVAALVGPNGAGKTTLLHLAVGLLSPSAGSVEILNGVEPGRPGQMNRVGFVPQEAPLYSSLSVADHLRLGERLNPGWDRRLAEQRIHDLDLDPGRPAGKLSGGQRAQLALTLALAKRPDLLLLDEPVANLDPLARREFLQSLMEFVADHGVTVVLSSHLVGDLARISDYLVLMMASTVALVGDVDELLAAHRRIIGPRCNPTGLPAGQEVIEASHTERQSTLLVRTEAAIHNPVWTVEEIDLEDLVLAYMGRDRQDGRKPIRSVAP